MSQLLLVLLLSSQAASEPEWQPILDPLAPAREGRVYCQSPNQEKKTCSGFSSYRVLEDGTIIGRAVGALNNDPPMSFAIEAKTEIKDGALCFVVRQSDLDKMYLMVGDQRFDSEPGDKLLASRRESMALEIMDKEICEKHFSDGNRLMMRTFVEGIESPEMSGEYLLLTDNSDYQLHTSYPLFDDTSTTAPEGQ